MTRALLVLAALLGCHRAPVTEPSPAATVKTEADVPQAAPPLAKGQAEAIFASGCFWCAESDFEKVPGVIDAVSGYAGGTVANPTYKQVGSGLTGHTEAIRVIYDPKQVDYATLLDWFWHHVDPHDGTGQFCDRGSQYRPAIFPVDETQRALAEASKNEVTAKLAIPVAVKIEEPGTFWVAEAYHQDFYETNPDHYQRYRRGCGRDARVAEVWSSVEGGH